MDLFLLEIACNILAACDAIDWALSCQQYRWYRNSLCI